MYVSFSLFCTVPVELSDLITAKTMNTDIAAVTSTLPPPGFGPIHGPVGDTNPHVVSMDDEAYEPPTYDEVFPPLATAVVAPNDQINEGVPGAMVSNIGRTSYARMAVKSSTITQVRLDCKPTQNTLSYPVLGLIS